MKSAVIYVMAILFTVAQSTSENPESRLGARLREGFSKGADIESCDGLIDREAVLVHSVFRILREHVSVLNGLESSVDARKRRRARSDHPEILDGITETIKRAKTDLSVVIRLVKKSKKIVRQVRSDRSLNGTERAELLQASNQMILQAIDQSDLLTEVTNASLSHHREGLYSRKQKVAAVIGDAPDRLYRLLYRLEIVKMNASDLQARIKTSCASDLEQNKASKSN